MKVEEDGDIKRKKRLIPQALVVATSEKIMTRQ